MSTKSLASRYGEFADLQKLGAAEQRHHLAEAVMETDKCIIRQDELANDVAEASARLETVFSSPVLCIDQLRLAGAKLHLCEDAKLANNKALENAKAIENNARTDWNRAQQTADWFADRNREMVRKEGRKLDEKAIARSVSLRLSSLEGEFS